MKRMLLSIVITLILCSVILSGAGSVRVRGVRAESRDAPIVGESDEGSMSAGSDSTYANCRFGLALTPNHTIEDYAVDPLNLGWYVDWSTSDNPLRPNGMEYAQMVRLSSSGYTPSGSRLLEIIAANPGSIWLIGNEPDSPVQDNIAPELYAQRYHEIYHIIKEADPTARIAAGGVVQPTPLRMEYLDQVLQAYVDDYGKLLPADAWHIHSFILREISLDYASQAGEPYWGAEIPVGLDALYGELYLWPDDTDDLEIFEARLRDFRQWMASRGYRNTRLWVTEYGTLADYYYGDPYVDSNGDPFDEARAREFMLGTFDVMLNLADDATGYPADNNRLVQRWVWYSSDDARNGGFLFDPMTLEPMMLAREWHTYTASLSQTVDLVAVSVDQLEVPLSPSAPATTTLRVRVSNAGNIALTQPVTVSVVDAESGDSILESYEVDTGLKGCAASIEFTFDWTNLSPGTHTLRILVDPMNRIAERDESNNVKEATVLIAIAQTYLPLVWRGF
jgi:hypothetical protein